MGTRPVERARGARGGFTYEQVSRRDLPFDWELIAGRIVARGRIGYWHRVTRETLAGGLQRARRAPYAVFADRRLLADEFTVARPDIVVVDESRVPAGCAPEYVPAESVALVVEIVSTISYSDEWFRKPQLYAAAGIANFWRVERGQDDRPIVYQYWLDDESGAYDPAPAGVHAETLTTAVPYPVHVDLSGIRACAPGSARAAYRVGDGARFMRSGPRCPERGRG
ncbi:Uma2 family endonuclease [Nocardia sp. NEAU-G5]|uniref:Uma2 family endonuclease n=1 Tax=Nocardia albiluteola TaxID=2842303 RepID=A0ABS6BBH9_9NOCA|nr:Uma2 family endonuclease [Nocardia albiluteola]MBU3067641.1 Uma2 family endonuclease [Nocardia albiluteola]